MLGFDAGELLAVSEKTFGTVVGEPSVFLEELCAIVGMMHGEARAECRIKPNDKLQGLCDQVRFKRLNSAEVA